MRTIWIGIGADIAAGEVLPNQRDRDLANVPPTVGRMQSLNDANEESRGIIWKHSLLGVLDREKARQGSPQLDGNRKVIDWHGVSDDEFFTRRFWDKDFGFPGDWHPDLKFMRADAIRSEHNERPYWRWRGVVAKPDAVYRFNADYLVVRRRSTETLAPAHPDPRELLDATICAIAAAQNLRHYCAAILDRGHEFLLVCPHEQTIEAILKLMGPVQRMVAPGSALASWELAEIVAMHLWRRGLRLP